MNQGSRQIWKKKKKRDYQSFVSNTCEYLSTMGGDPEDRCEQSKFPYLISRAQDEVQK